MKKIQYILFFTAWLISSCITQFIPETTENQELLVVEGLITDQPEAYTIKLSRSLPLGVRDAAEPVAGCTVFVTDESENRYSFVENKSGIYSSNPSVFRGVPGKRYKLHIFTNSSFGNNYSYESFPMEMKPVPPVDTIYYEKIKVDAGDGFGSYNEHCQVYLDTHDPDNLCKYFRWNYTETWEFRLPFQKPVNKTCWISNESSSVNIKNTSGLSESVVDKYPLNYITGATDRLRVKYSMLVNQYSLNEDEFVYWEKLSAVTQNVGSLYDITPASIPNNIVCIEDPSEKVLGYFSVSAKSSKRVFIKDNFRGVVNLYSQCIEDTVFTANENLPGINMWIWILETHQIPPYQVVTTNRNCADCTVRGTIVEPYFWGQFNQLK
jgi:hypothetical protein